MNKFVELPLIEPIYSTYQYQGPGSVILASNPSIRNWYLNEVMLLTCNRKFLSGVTTPNINIVHSYWIYNPYLEQRCFSMQFLNGYVNPLIRNLLDSGYYVCYEGADDYYIKGKSWYNERHFIHDGMICGYNQKDKTYCLYSYDSNWVYRKFWTTQKSFDKGRKSAFQRGTYGRISGIKPKKDIVEFSPGTACQNITEYLDPSTEKYLDYGKENVFGIAVHEYIAKYIGKLSDGSIPYERMDWRVFRLIWEHKKAMLERIQCIETSLKVRPDISKRYAPLVTEADKMRMLYASYHMKRRDSLLPVIQKKLLVLKEKEQNLLEELLEKTGGIYDK